MERVTVESRKVVVAQTSTSSEPTELDAPARVGLLGPTYSGKTTYFAVLDRALRDLDWRVEVQNPNADDPARSFLINDIRRYINRGYFPKKTPDHIPDQGLYFRVSKGKRVFELNFFDPPGEIFEPLGHEYNWETQGVIFDSIQNAKGIIMLLHLDKTPHELMNIWHYSIESFIHHVRKNGDVGRLIQNDQLAIRTAVVFTKADNLPWMGRHRSRNAEAWLKGNEGLRALSEDIRRDCSNVRFFFSSAVGWNKGKPNCRTSVRPRQLFNDGGVRPNSDARQHVGNLIPDPAEGERSEEYRRQREDSSRRAATLPLFSDPLRFTEHELHPELARGLTGVITLPGRNPPSAEAERFLTPWNIVEPLLWAAGFDEM